MCGAVRCVFVLVRIPNVPVDLYFANNEQLDDAVRQLWIVIGDVDGALPVSGQDAAMTEEILRAYRPQRDRSNAQAAAARAAGAATFTIEIELPERALADLERLGGLLVRLDRLCTEQGIALPASPEIRAFRRDLLAAIADQLRASRPA